MLNWIYIFICMHHIGIEVTMSFFFYVAYDKFDDKRYDDTFSV